MWWATTTISVISCIVACIAAYLSYKYSKNTAKLALQELQYVKQANKATIAIVPILKNPEHNLATLFFQNIGKHAATKVKISIHYPKESEEFNQRHAAHIIQYEHLPPAATIEIPCHIHVATPNAEQLILHITCEYFDDPLKQHDILEQHFVASSCSTADPQYAILPVAPPED